MYWVIGQIIIPTSTKHVIPKPFMQVSCSEILHANYGIKKNMLINLDYNEVLSATFLKGIHSLLSFSGRLIYLKVYIHCTYILCLTYKTSVKNCNDNIKTIV